MTRSIFLAPPSVGYEQDRFFDADNVALNRDDILMPFIRLRRMVEAGGDVLHTSDLLNGFDMTDQAGEYYSLGMLDDVARLPAGLRLRAFVIMEPPVVAPNLYAALPRLTRQFERVYVHNTQGDGYSLAGVDLSRLHKLYWPLPYKKVLEPFWRRRERMKRMVVINGSHRPRSRHRELYSTRIAAISALSRLDAVDLYGRGWGKWWSPKALWWPYWRHRRQLMQVYKGSCPSKFEVLSQYTFSLCFENMQMAGYITEKIFDCFYAGTVPVYLGASDIQSLLPAEAYIDARQFDSWEELWRMLSSLTSTRIDAIRDAGRAFMESELADKYVYSMEQIFAVAHE